MFNRSTTRRAALAGVIVFAALSVFLIDQLMPDRSHGASTSTSGTPQAQLMPDLVNKVSGTTVAV
jgi:hypothetical protein